MFQSWKVGKLERWKVGKLGSWEVEKLGNWKVRQLECWKLEVGKSGPESWKEFVGSPPPQETLLLVRKQCY